MLSKLLPTAVLVSTLCLNGCVDRSGIQAQSHALENDQLDLGHLAEHATETAWPEQNWWHLYQDPQLNQWIEQAIKTSPSLKVTQARIRKAYAIAGITQAQSRLQGDVSASIKRKQWPDDHFYGPGDLARSNSWDNQTSGSFSYDLDLWGRIKSQTQQAKDSIEVANAQALSARLELQGQIVEQYVLLGQYHTQLEVTRKELKHRKQLIELAKERLRLGLGTQMHVSQATQALPAVKRQEDIYVEAIALTQNRLAALGGLPLSAAQQLQAPTLGGQQKVGLPKAMPLELLAKRPDVQAALWQVSAASQAIKVREADFYPNINITAQIAALATQGSMLGFLTERKTMANVGPALSLPMFDGGRRRDALGAANADYDLAIESYNQTLVSALAQISEQLIRWHSLTEQEHFVHEALSIAKHNAALAELRYHRGLSDYQSVLEAEAEVFAQEHLAAQVRSQQLNTQARLLVALGGGESQANLKPLLSEPAP